MNGEQEKTHVAVTSEHELLVHAGNDDGAHVGAVHQTDAVHGANGDDQADVNAADNGLLLCRSKSVGRVIALRDRAHIVEVLALNLFLRHGEAERGGGGGGRGVEGEEGSSNNGLN